jgi:hypothetical protein
MQFALAETIPAFDQFFLPHSNYRVALLLLLDLYSPCLPFT